MEAKVRQNKDGHQCQNHMEKCVTKRILRSSKRDVLGGPFGSHGLIAEQKQRE